MPRPNPLLGSLLQQGANALSDSLNESMRHDNVMGYQDLNSVYLASMQNQKVTFSPASHPLKLTRGDQERSESFDVTVNGRTTTMAISKSELDRLSKDENMVFSPATERGRNIADARAHGPAPEHAPTGNRTVDWVMHRDVGHNRYSEDNVGLPAAMRLANTLEREQTPLKLEPIAGTRDMYRATIAGQTANLRIDADAAHELHQSKQVSFGTTPVSIDSPGHAAPAGVTTAAPAPAEHATPKPQAPLPAPSPALRVQPHEAPHAPEPPVMDAPTVTTVRQGLINAGAKVHVVADAVKEHHTDLHRHDFHVITPQGLTTITPYRLTPEAVTTLAQAEPHPHFTLAASAPAAPSVAHAAAPAHATAAAAPAAAVHEPVHAPAPAAPSREADGLRKEIMGQLTGKDGAAMRDAIDQKIGGADHKFDDKDLNKLQTASLKDLQDIIGTLKKSGVGAPPAGDHEAGHAAAPASAPQTQKSSRMSIA